jgi:hypothetical protein
MASPCSHRLVEFVTQTSSLPEGDPSLLDAALASWAVVVAAANPAADIFKKSLRVDSLDIIPSITKSILYLAEYD